MALTSLGMIDCGHVVDDEYYREKLEECEQTYYGGVSDHVALLCEAYAQYLCKSYGIA